MDKKSGFVMNNPDLMYFLELRKHFLGVKYLNSFMRIRVGKNSDPRWRKAVSGIRD
jgi:hypothetical protein